MKKIRQLCIVMLAALMMFSSVGIKAKEQPQTAAQDVKIEVIHDGEVVESGYNRLTHHRNYVRSTSRTNGDEIVITAPEGVHYLMVQLDEFCGVPKTSGMAQQEQAEGTQRPSDMSSLEYGEALVYLMNDEFRFIIPSTSGTDASNNALGGGNWPYDPRAFSTSGNTEKIITARVATEEEINARRNLALNPYDQRGNDNTQSGAIQRNDTSVFPHAFANRVTDNKREFEPRNAIDGYEFNASHVGFPYQSWGCGNVETDSEFSIMFGRYVAIDQIDITLRAQWNPPQPNNANDHDINWTSATLEFSDGTEMDIELEKLASPQTFKLPEKKVVSWVRMKNLPVSEETIPVDGRKKFSALTEFKVWGTEASYDEAQMPDGEQIVSLAQKINDYWIRTGGNTGSDATNYNHGHSVSSEFWAPSVFYTGNMEAYYLTGDENYTDYANRWGSNNLYNGSAWNTNANSSRIGKYFPDNHTSFQTYLDMYSITAEGDFDPSDEKIANVVPIMEEMKEMSVSDLKNRYGYWDRIDFFYMELPNWTKMYLLTGDEGYLDKQRELYDDRKQELYDEESGLFYRDRNYIYDPDAVYDPASSGNNQKISPNGKKVLWARGNGWAMAALARVLEDLPDDREEDRLEYETTFKKMAETLIQVQGEDGFWRMNLDDHAHDIRPETSGTVFFAYGLTWGINHGLLDKETYYPAVRKAFLGLNANAFRPDGLVGRSELISAYPNPNCSLGIGSSQSYAPAAAVLFLSELSKLESQGYVRDDVEPALNKRMIGAVAVKEGSPYAVVNSRVTTLDETGTMTAITQDGKAYVPLSFLSAVYGEESTDGLSDIILHEGEEYAALNDVCGQENRILSTVKDGITIVSYKEQLFDPVIDAKLTALLDQGLSDGRYPERPKYEIRFDYTPSAQTPKPADDALISVGSSTSGAVSASREIGPSTDEEVTLSFDMVSVLSPNQTNAIVGIGSSNSAYTAYSQVPIIIRMYKDGCFGAYDGNGYVQSSVKFAQNEKYRLEVRIDLHAGTYDVVVTSPDGTQTQIADDFAFRSTAQQPDDIGKIYLFNNDQAAGKYWLEDIFFGERLKPGEDALVSVGSSTSGAISASREIVPCTQDDVQVDFDMVTLLDPKQTNAIVGIGSSDSAYGAYGQVPIIIRMFNDGYFGAYDGSGYVQSDLAFTANERYHLCVRIDRAAQTYSVQVTTPQGETVQIAEDFAFRSTAQQPDDIGKIYLFNNDQAEGRYWIEHITSEERLRPSDDALISVEPSTSGAISASREIGPSTSKRTTVSFDAVTTLPADQTNAIIGIGAAGSDYHAYAQVPIVIRMFNDGYFSVYDGTRFVRSDVRHAANTKYLIRAGIDLERQTYSVYVTLPDGTEQQIAQDFAFRTTAQAPAAIGKIYLFNNDQEAGRYWLENITLTDEQEHADKETLNAAIERAEALDETAYTAESWAAMQEALNAAKTVAADAQADQTAVDAAEQALTSAIDALEKVSEPAGDAAVQALRDMVDKAIALGAEDEALNEAVANAQAVLAKEAPTTTEVVTALLDLSEAMQALNTDESTDALREDVQATIDFITEHILSNVDNVRPGKVQALVNAVEAAKAVLADDQAAADELKAANRAMTKAAQELWEIVAKTELNALIEAANGYLDGDYTAESLEALQAAIESAQAAAINDDATTAEVTEAITNLSNAIAGLEAITLDTSALEHEIELVSEMIANIDNYVPSSVEGLQEKLDAAKTALSNATTQAEIDEATKTLREARLNARTKADTSALEEIIAYANSLDLAGYAAESRNMLDRTIVAVKRVLADPEATQEGVDQAVQTMQTAIDSLQLVENSAGSTTADTANTAAAAQTAAFAGMLAVSAAAILMVNKRRRRA